MSCVESNKTVLSGLVAGLDVWRCLVQPPGGKEEMKWISTALAIWRVFLCLCSFLLIYNGSYLFGIGLPLLVFIEWSTQQIFRKTIVAVIFTLLCLQITLLWAFYSTLVLQHQPDTLPNLSNFVDIRLKSVQESVSNHIVKTKTSSTVPKVFSKFHSQDAIVSQVNSQIDFSSQKFNPSYSLPQIQVSQYQTMFGELPVSDFPDLKYRSSEVVRKQLTRIFQELPENFDPRFRNPCWVVEGENTLLLQQHEKKRLRGKRNQPRNLDPDLDLELDRDSESTTTGLTCLPYVYILGQPKSGTSDLWNRLVKHPNIHPPLKKEIRWFTRGEFTTTLNPSDVIDESTSIYDYTSKFSPAVKYILQDPKHSITVDGGPHTLWWPTQSPDGTLRPDDIPPTQLIREIQPNAKFLITLSNPISRMYSDYYFLGDDRKVAKHPSKGRSHVTSDKSPYQFHERVIQQVNEFHECVEVILQKKNIASESRTSPTDSASKILGNFPILSNITDTLSGMIKDGLRPKIPSAIINEWFRASQVCAHDRHKFGLAGYGRIGIGLYILFIEKWLEHFKPDQFLILRLENFDENPEEYMNQIFTFLNLTLPSAQSQMDKILTEHIANQHHYDREEMYVETEEILKKFYRPYNVMLAQLLMNRDFLWENPKEEKSQIHLPIPEPKVLDKDSMEHPPFKLTPKPDEISRKHEEEIRKIKSNSKSNLRRSSEAATEAGAEEDIADEEELVLTTPHSFSLEGLPLPESDAEMNEFVKSIVQIPVTLPLTVANSYDMLCTATLGMDLVALKYLLYDLGLPGTIRDDDGTRTTLFHCLAQVGIFGEAISRSYVFPLLKGKKTWLTPLFDPPLPLLLSSVHSLDIKVALTRAINRTFSWLLAAGADPNAVDANGNTPLHLAAASGLESLVESLLKSGSNPLARNRQERTPLHYAVAYGYGKIGSILVQHGSELEARDNNGVTPMDIVSSPGVISPIDALKYFSIVQSPVRNITRTIHPELDLSVWRGGTGGYNPHRLKGFEDDMKCDVDQYWAHEITGKEVFEKYFARNRPILIRGLIDKWPAVEKYQVEELMKDHGEEMVQVSPIPYSNKFGGEGVLEQKLSEYIHDMRSHNLTGGSHPWYVFKGHPIRAALTNAPNSLVYHDIVPTPKLITESLHYVNMGSNYNPKETLSRADIESLGRSRKDFINAQWALGGEGTGAPVHYHNTAWNALLYGAKKWILYPPSHMIMSNKQILDFIETDLIDFENRGIHYATCVQIAGDVLIAPESWGHGVLNIQESIAVATESKGSMWRITEQLRAVKHLPDDNRKRSEK